MSKIVLFSDIHIHPFGNYSTILPNGLNSRVQDSINCITQIKDYCITNNIDAVLFGGDLFHERRQVTTSTYNAGLDAIKQLAGVVPIFAISGNHDQSDKLGTTHSLHGFHNLKNVTVADKPGSYIFSGWKYEYEVVAIPYTENTEMLKEIVNNKRLTYSLPRIQLIHTGIQGATIGTDFVYANPTDPTLHDLACSKYDLVVLGHFHKHQQLAENCWYIGSPLAHNWSDKGEIKGFLVYDTETKTIEQISLKAPRFIEYNPKLAFAGMPFTKGDFVKLIDVNIKDWSEDKRAELKENLELGSLELVSKEVEKFQTNRVRFTAGSSFDDIINQYVEAGILDLAGLDENYLIEVGRDILKSVKE